MFLSIRAGDGEYGGVLLEVAKLVSYADGDYRGLRTAATIRADDGARAAQQRPLSQGPAANVSDTNVILDCCRFITISFSFDNSLCYRGQKRS